MRRWTSSPLAIGAVVLFAYTGWAGWARHAGHDWREWADVGRYFASRSSSEAIRDDARFSASRYGYDGQFFLYIAQVPRKARPAIDNESYRYGRIGYPIAARALALDRTSAIPAMLVVLNIVAVAGGTTAIAAWLRRRELSGWFALLYAAFPGAFFAVWRDLSETLAYSLTAAAVLVFTARRPSAIAASSALFAAAALTRETTLLYAFVWAATLVAQRRWRAAALFALGAALPYAGWRIFIRLWLGHFGSPEQTRPTFIPFKGVLSSFPWDGAELQRVYAVFLPGLFCVGVAAYALYRGVREPAIWALFLNGLLFVVFLPSGAYADWKSAGRLSTGVVLALLLSLPALDAVMGAARAWFWVPIVAWFAPWYALIGTMFQSRWD